MRISTLVVCLLSMTALVLATPSFALSVNASLCGRYNTYNSATFSPAPGKYVQITAVACGVGSGTFTSEHHAVECSTSSPASDWSFGSGYYEYYAFKPNGHFAYDHLTNINNTCPNTSQDLGNVGASTMNTDFSLTVTYVPTNNSTTLLASANDCAFSPCPN